ncbi:hypothetical protein [Achromobacter pestifer]
MKILIVAAWMALACGPALARDGVPTVPQPPASARTLPDNCLGTSCPRVVDPGRAPADCLGASCGTGRNVSPAAPGADRGNPPAWSGPAQPRLPPMPSQSGQPVGPLTPGPRLPR